MKTEVAVVIPTIRNLSFLREWRDEFKDCLGVIVEDHAKKEIETPKKYFQKVCHYTWKDIDKSLGKNSWIISRKNAGIRSFGFLKAWELKADIIITLDDDCYPVAPTQSGRRSAEANFHLRGRSPRNEPERRRTVNFVQQHLENLFLYAPTDWQPTYPHRRYFYTRGIPYSIRNKKEVVISHGLWSGVLDFDAPTQLLHNHLQVPENFDFIEFIPQSYFFPMCSMNLAFKTKITPLMYFPLMCYDPEEKHLGYDRFDDIWAGLFAKKILDHLGLSIVNGSPFVEHRKASDPFKNLQKEAKGIEANERLYKEIAKVRLSSKNTRDCYIELAEKVHFPKEDYFDYLKKAMKIWANLF